VPVLVVVGVCRGLSGGASWVPLLSGASFEVEAGEVVAVVGGRLSGKTTLLRVAAGIEVPEEGSVRLGGRELVGLSERERVRLRGRELVWLNRAGMSQPLEVVKIVGWPLAVRRGRREAERRAGQMLERVGALDCARRRWADLSPREQLLVGFAQAFAAAPRVVVIDDLLDALGSRATKEASDLLRSLIAEAEPRPGVLMSASDRDSAVFADRVWSLGSGGKLTPTSGHRDSDAEILPLRRRDEGDGSRRVG
jgi:predicted ABC-type transport system involved in lysophospholipase L1 biosynthesis ATPase subunit